MSRCNTILAAALAAAAIAAPTALARPIDIHAGLGESAAPAHERHSGAFRTEIPDPVQDLRSPDARDAARPDTTDDAAVTDAALAQERYYSSYDDAPKAPRAVTLDTGDGIARAPFVLAILGALVVGLGAGSALHLVRARRRQAAGLAT